MSAVNDIAGCPTGQAQRLDILLKTIGRRSDSLYGMFDCNDSSKFRIKVTEIAGGSYVPGWYRLDSNCSGAVAT
jgi:hypothetical protein